MYFFKEFKDCYIIFDKQILKIGNSTIERQWLFNRNFPSAISLKNKLTGKEWVAGADTNQLEDVMAFNKMGIASDDIKLIGIDAEVCDDIGIAEEGLKVITKFACAQTELHWIHLIYPSRPILRVSMHCITNGPIEGSSCKEYEASFENLEVAEDQKDMIIENYLDYLRLKLVHARWKHVRLNDVTDHHNNLVKTGKGLFYPGEKNMLQGNLLFVEDLLGKEGMILVKEGPTPLAYQGEAQNDFLINGNAVYICGWGMTNEELEKHGSISSYGSSIILWHGAEDEALIALNDYHRAIHRFNACKDAYIMSNTWGDRSKDGRICEEFIEKELEAASLLGINYCQIDDGWETGITANSVFSGGVWEGYYKNNPEFWQPNTKRFPKGLEPISQSAGEKGIALGLWFSPDSTENFANWEKDAGILINLHRKYGVVSFKLDGIKIRSKKGEENLYCMMEKVVSKTGGRVFFNLDVTAEVRNGYFGRVQYASMFLENRYTDWHNYFPHWTLRNLWMLSKYYPTFRLQAEFLNVKRNTALYENDVLSPANCGIEYAFAVTLCANPLAWMELSGLDSQSLTILESVIKVYRSIQTELLGGYVMPIGEEPSGTGWTGFQSVTGKGKGFILLIREYNDRSTAKMRLRVLRNTRLELSRVLGSGRDEAAEIDENGSCTFKLEEKLSYCLYRYHEQKNMF